MPNMEITITPSTVVFASAYGKLARGFTTFRVPLEAAVRRVMIPSISQNFEEGGRPSWEQLSDATIERRDREGTLGGEPQDILVESGTLFGDALRLARWEISGRTAMFTNLPSRSAYGRFHQTGTDNMPARPFVVMQDEDVDRIREIFELWRDGQIITNWAARIRKFS
jgi:phage gpG-like protein